MKALCYRGESDIRYEDVPDATIEDDADVIVRVDRCGICGSDLHIYHGQVGTVAPGCPIGHEAVGEVVETGRAVRKLRAGARVILAPMMGCGQCDACARGMLNRCRVGPPRGYGFGFGLGGCQAEAVRVPDGDRNALPIPDGVALDQALMLTDNLPTAYAACLRADIPMGGSVAVIGLGCIGLLAVECAFLLGAARVFAIDPVAERRELARGMGAYPLHPESAAEEIRALTSGDMVDSVVEAVGHRQTVALAFALVGKMRTVSIAGSGQAVTETGPNIAIDVAMNAFYFGTTIRIMPMTEVMRYWDELIPHLQFGRLHPTRLITDSLPLAAGSEAYRRFDRKEAGILKVVLTP